MPEIRAVGAGLTLFLCLLFSTLQATAGADFMTTGVGVAAPIGHRIFCRESPEECLPDDNKAAEGVRLTPDLIRKVAEINTHTNTSIKPISDRVQFGVEEHWSYPVKGGDCEDYVLLKRRQLHAAGIPLSDLLITVVRKPDGEGHAILTLHSSTGDFVLDNLDWRVKAWRDTPYTYVKRQSTTDPRQWVSLGGGTEALVAAVRK